MKATIVAIVSIAALGFSLALDAQQPAGADPEAGRRVARQLERMKRRLGLSDGQAERIKAILTATEERVQGLRKGQGDRIKEVLNNEQRDRFERMAGRNRSGRGGAMMRGMMGRWIGPALQRMRAQLNLTPEQEKKIRKVLSKSSGSFTGMWREIQEKGWRNVDWTKFREKMKKAMDGLMAQVRPLLDDEQKKKYDELVKQMGSRWGRWGGGGRPGRGPGDRRRPGRPAPAERAEVRIERAMRVLNLAGEEAAVVKPLVAGIVNAQVDLRKNMRQLRDEIEKKVAGKAPGDQIKGLLDRARALRKKNAERIARLREELRELLVLEQEARMVAQGIL